MKSSWFFLDDKWIGSGCMVSGVVSGGYAFHNCLHYWFQGKIDPPILGKVDMAFATAASLVINGLALFWLGWLTIENADRDLRQVKRTRSRETIELLLAVISSITMIVVALIGSRLK